MKELDESVWMDIHKHSNGDIERKEDFINELSIGGFIKYLNDSYEVDFTKEICEYLDGWIRIYVYKDDFARMRIIYYNGNLIKIRTETLEQMDIMKRIESIYTLEDDKSSFGCKDIYPKDHTRNVSNKFFLEVYDYLLSSVKYPMESIVTKKYMNESVWVDIHKQSTGEVERKEDEMPKEALEKLDKCYYYYAYLIVSEDKPETLDGFCDYLEDDLEKYPYKDAILKYVEDNWADEVADTLDGWVDQARIDYNKDMYECEGVPGGLTPVDVGGMGPAYFPGPNGEPGSGDLPSPTGKVYQQVAPFGIFVNSLYGKRKKKRKKKFRKEDELCVHSPNAKVYDYVDDYREYVDRTYDNMDRKK